MEGRRRSLAAAVKWLSLFGLGMFAFALIGSLPQEPGEESKPDRLEVAIGDLAPGEVRRLLWGQRQVIVLRRTPEMLRSVEQPSLALADPDSQASRQPAEARTPYRSALPELFLAIGHGPESGCPVEYLAPARQVEGAGPWFGGFRDPCTGALYDSAGRVLSGQAGRRNLPVPRSRPTGPGRIIIELSE